MMIKGPLTFTQANLAKVISGEKTQTRRIEKLSQINQSINTYKYIAQDRHGDGAYCFDSIPFGMARIQPRHQVGDICYLPEKHQLEPYEHNRSMFAVACIYTDGTENTYYLKDYPQLANTKPNNGKWRSPRFMFKFMARYFVRITGVGPPHRVQNISLASIQAEGIPDDRATHNAPKQLAKWERVWVDINGQESWDRNDWVMPYTFEKVKGV